MAAPLFCRVFVVCLFGRLVDWLLGWLVGLVLFCQVHGAPDDLETSMYRRMILSFCYLCLYPLPGCWG